MKYILIILTLIIFQTESFSQQIRFQKIYGTGDYNYGRQVIPQKDSTFVILGNTSLNGNNDIYIAKIDSIGNLIWNKTIGNSAIEWANAFRQTYDKGFIITGFTNAAADSAYNVLIVKTDSSGNLEWQKTYGGINWDIGNDIIITHDSGFAIVGNTNSFGAGNNDVYLIRTNSKGDTLWTKTYGGANDVEGNSITLANDSGFVICGATKSFGNGEFDIYIIKTDNNGKTIYTKTFGDTLNDKGLCIIPSHDIGYVISCYSQNISLGNEAAYILKIDETGIKLWDHHWTVANDSMAKSSANSICLSKDGGYVFAGNNTSNGNKNIYLFKMDDSGNFINGTIYGNDYEENAYSIEPTIDGGFIVAGYSYSYTKQTIASMYIIKTDSMIFSNPYDGIKENKLSNNEIKIYPNPFTSFIDVDINNSNLFNKKLNFYLMNTFGQIVYSTLLNQNSQIEINKNLLSSGIYFYKIINESDQLKISFGKLIKQ